MDISGAQLFRLIISVYLIYYLKTMEGSVYLEVTQKLPLILQEQSSVG